ncbi:MAG: hypothetical protein ACUVQ8_01935 [Nitrososphaeria archaeon]
MSRIDLVLDLVYRYADGATFETVVEDVFGEASMKIRDLIEYYLACSTLKAYVNFFVNEGRLKVELEGRKEVFRH